MTDLPEQFVRRMKEMLGEEELQAFLSSYNRPRVQGLRINPLKLGISPGIRSDAPGAFCGDGRQPEEVLRALLPQEWDLRPVPWARPYGFYFGTRAESGGTVPEMGPGARSSPEQVPSATAADRAAGKDIPRPGLSPLHDAGLFYIQEPSAMAAAVLSGTRPGERVLDLCAAPGGKTTMLAAMLGGRGLLVSNEIDRQRAEILSRNVERMGIPNAVVTNERSDRLAGRFPDYFDRVLVDAPCSGEGMFRKEEQALLMWSPENVRNCAGRQARILDQAARMVRAGGTLIYSTCTFAPEENEGTVAAFLTRHPEFRAEDLPAELGEERMCACGFSPGRPEWVPGSLPEENNGPDGCPPAEVSAVECRRMAGDLAPAAQTAGTIRLWPHRLPGEGHYIAVLRRKGRPLSEEIPKGWGMATAPVAGGRKAAHRHLRKGAPSRESVTPEATAYRLARDHFSREGLLPELESIADGSGAGTVLFGEELYLLPCARELRIDGLRILRAGLHLGTVRKNRFEPAHALAMALRPGMVRASLNLPGGSREAIAYLQGETIPCDLRLQGWVLVTIDGISAGWGKASGGMLRNHYPKGLRRMRYKAS